MKNKLSLLFASILLCAFGVMALSKTATAVPVAIPTADMRCGENWLQVNPSFSGETPGSTETVVQFIVPAQLAGKTVTATADVTNLTTNHSGSNVIVSYGADSFTLSDVESSTAQYSIDSHQFTLGAAGTSVDMKVQFGSSGAYEAREQLSIKADCVATGTLACGINDLFFPYAAIYGHDGSTYPLAVITVPANLQGLSVNSTTTVTNNVSIHPNSNIHVSSNSTTYQVDNVEQSALKVTTNSGLLTLGSTLSIDVEIGSDQVYSAEGQLALKIDCPTGGQGGGSAAITTSQVTAVPKTINAGSGGAKEVNPASVLGLAASLMAMGLGIRRFSKNVK